MHDATSTPLMMMAFRRAERLNASTRPHSARRPRRAAPPPAARVRDRRRRAAQRRHRRAARWKPACGSPSRPKRRTARWRRAGARGERELPRELRERHLLRRGALGSVVAAGAQLTPASGLIDGLQKGIQSCRQGRARAADVRAALGVRRARHAGASRRTRTLIYDVELVDVDRDGFDERDDDTSTSTRTARRSRAARCRAAAPTSTRGARAARRCRCGCRSPTTRASATSPSILG